MAGIDAVKNIFSLPKYTTEQFEAARTKYTDQHGFTVYVPGFSDIIKINREKPMTKVEQDWWTNKEYKKFSRERMAEINRMKEKRRERLQRMLASPSPEFARTYASTMTALDNAEDAITTLAVIGRLACHALPRMLGRLLAGPVGWLMTASAFLDLAQVLMNPFLLCKGTKRIMDQLCILNPASAKARMKKAQRLNRVMPSVGEFLEMGQVTNDLFGVGICLGPLMGLMMDVAFGTLAKLAGMEVKVKYWDRDLPYHRRVAHSVLRHMPLIMHHGDGISDEDHSIAYLASNFAWQVAGPYLDEINPMDAIDGVMNIQLPAPQPGNALTREVITEAGLDIVENSNWPGGPRRFTTFPQLMDKTATKASGHFKMFCNRHKDDWYGFLLGTNAIEGTLRAMGHTETLDMIFWEQTCISNSFRELHDMCLSFTHIIDNDNLEELHRLWIRTGIIRTPDWLDPKDRYLWKCWTHQDGHPIRWFTLSSCVKMALDLIVKNCERPDPYSVAYRFSKYYDPCFGWTHNPTWRHYAEVPSPVYPMG